jgi:signal peptide peptidase SppA
MTTHFLAEALATPWALQPERLSAYAAALSSRYLGQRPARAGGMDENDHGAPRKPQAAPQAARPGTRTGAIAVVGVYGTITQRANMMSICDGGTSTQAISNALRQANADETVNAIVLDIDSPGGSVYGIAELAAEIRASAKPVTAIANSLAASAAYWLGTAAAELYVTPGGEVGSIGVWMAHEDWSKALEEAGVATTLISAGKFKTEGNPYAPLDADARSFMQSRVNDYYGAFTRDVAKGRKCGVDQVRSGMGQGRVLGADQAKTEGMVDGIMTFDQVLRQVARNIAPPKSRNVQQQRRTQLALLVVE